MIRQATRHDIPAMVALGAAMHQESIFATFNYDHEKVAQHICNLIQGDFGIALVSEDDGVIQGGFLGGVIEHYFGFDRQAFDYALFIAPECRSGTLGMRLIKAYIEEAKLKCADQITLANSTGYMPERVARLFEAAGFQRLGYVFALNTSK